MVGGLREPWENGSQSSRRSPSMGICVWACYMQDSRSYCMLSTCWQSSESRYGASS